MTSTSDVPPSISDAPADTSATKIKFKQSLARPSPPRGAPFHGHDFRGGLVLMLPCRVVPRYEDMTPEEVTDMWLLAQKIRLAFELHRGCTSSTYTIQDGPAAGRTVAHVQDGPAAEQTVAHVHVHIMSRREVDFVPNYKIYNEIQVEENEKEAKRLRIDAEENRPARTMDDMEAEAKELRKVLEEFERKAEAQELR
ncbi:unnamed protein product [Closterium sp. NIES-64]|nr:unnamed protein product [Closterium sp. NIES-64]CAI5997289.1 unnamed protein product [Closterium sp. NIES-64]